MIEKIAFLLIVLACGLSQNLVQAKCQTCMPLSHAYCIDETSYFLCLDGENLTNGTRTKCPSDHVCTGTKNICEPKRSSQGITNTPLCGSSCGKCPDPNTSRNNLYTCVSRTQFGRCVKDSIIVTAKCGKGEICSSELYEKSGIICAPQCVTDFHRVSSSCDSDEIVTTTTSASPPIATGNLKKQCADAAPNFNKRRIFYIPNANDDECKTYIFCEKINKKEFDGLLVKCATGNYFNPSTEKCGIDMPTECNPRPTTLTPTVPTTEVNPSISP